MQHQAVRLSNNPHLHRVDTTRAHRCLSHLGGVCDFVHREEAQVRVHGDGLPQVRHRRPREIRQKANFNPSPTPKHKQIQLRQPRSHYTAITTHTVVTCGGVRPLIFNQLFFLCFGIG